MKLIVSLLFIACAILPLLAQEQPQDAAAKTVVVAQDGSGDIQGKSDVEISEAIQRVAKASGGTVLIKEGTYLIGNSIALGPETKGVTIEGVGNPVLKFAPQVRTVTSAEAKPGDATLKVQDGAAFRPGMTVEIQAPGAVDSFSGYRPKYFCATVQAASAAEIQLRKPIRFAVPVGTNVLSLHNVFQMDRCKQIAITGLVLDGDAKKEDIGPIDHVHHCGIMGTGPYDYVKGPVGPPLENLRVENCTVRNFFHRGIAVYSVEKVSVINCRIENCGAEAIDFDHFAYHCSATGNKIASAPVGVELNDASYTTVSDNEMRDCGIGVNIWRWCKHDNLNVENKVLKNTILSPKTYGIRCDKGTARNLIEENTVQGGSGAGIVLDGKANVAKKNTISAMGKTAILVNGEGMEIVGNTCSDPEAKWGTVDAISLQGSNHRVCENMIRTRGGRAFRKAVNDTSKGSTVEANTLDAEPLNTAPGK